MTAVIGVVSDGRVFMAGDSAVCWGDRVSIDNQPKVWRRGRIVLGAAGGMRATNVMRAWKPPSYDGATTPDEWMTTTFEPALREAMGRKKDWDVLVGVGGQLFTLDYLNSHQGFACGYGAIGNGGAIALGAMRALDRMQKLGLLGDVPVRERLTTALLASEAECNSVRRPFRFVSTRILEA